MAETKVCTKCKRELPIKSFRKIGYGVNSWCKECCQEDVRQYQKTQRQIKKEMPWYDKY